MYVYESGTTDLKSIYSDAGLEVPVSNPIIGDSKGFLETFFWSGVIDIVLKDASDNTINSLFNVIDFQTDVLSIIQGISYGVYFGYATGSGDDIDASITSLSANDFFDGQFFIVRANATYSGTSNKPDLTINDLPARRIKKENNAALTSKDIIAGLYLLLVYNESQNVYYLVNADASHLRVDGSVPMQGKITNLTDGTDTQDVLNLRQAQAQAYKYAVASGTANALIANFNPAIVTLSDGMSLLVKIAATNTNTATLKINDNTAVAIKGRNGQDIQAADLLVNTIHEFVYLGGVFVLMTQGAIKVGGVYHDTGVTETNPQTQLGYGNWSKVEAVFLVGQKDADANFATSGSTGGARNITLDMSYIPQHSHSIPAITGESTAFNAGGGTEHRTNTAGAPQQTSTGNAGSATPIPVPTLPPYQVAFIWKRV